MIDHSQAEQTEYVWSEITSFTTTITAATRLIIIDDNTNTTSTSLIFNDLPDGFTLPPMNSAGTQIRTVRYVGPGATATTTTVLTFPTEFIAYPTGI